MSCRVDVPPAPAAHAPPGGADFRLVLRKGPAGYGLVIGTDGHVLEVDPAGPAAGRLGPGYSP